MLVADAVIAGKYRVIKKLGEGAMGSVWLARNEITDREFAIKVLQPDVASDPAGLTRFFREARVCGTLRHPSILEIYDAGTAPELGGAPYLVMERLDGAALDVVLRQRGALEPRLALDILLQCARGLHLAHQKGVVHRDLKPANIFLHRPGTGALEPKVLDFGISKVVGKTPEIAITQSSTVLGSPLYMSPEQMDMKTLDARSDVHALGVVLWQCLVGTAPFSASSYNSLVVEIMCGPRPKLRDALPTASAELAAIVERAFALDPAARFASAEALADAIEVELAAVGGGVLVARTAGADVLGPLDLSSKPPPPEEHSSTTQPISADPLPKAGPFLPSDSSASASDAFLATVLAPEVAPRSGVSALAISAAAASKPRRRRRLPVAALLAGGVVLAIGAGALALSRHTTPGAASTAPFSSVMPAVPSSSAPPTASALQSVETAGGGVGPSGQEPAANPASPTASARPPRPTVAPATSKPHAAASSATPRARPRIDESGL